MLIQGQLDAYVTRAEGADTEPASLMKNLNPVIFTIRMLTDDSNCPYEVNRWAHGLIKRKFSHVNPF